MKPAHKPLVHSLRKGGSGRGLTYYSGAVLCSKRRMLDDQAEAQGLPSSGEDENTLLGSMYHAYHELADRIGREKLDTQLVEFAGDGLQFGPSETARVTAENLFRAYRARFPLGTLGMLLTAEEVIDLSSVEAPWKPAGMQLTMAADRIEIIHVQHSSMIRKYRNINIPPGYYARDYKTDGSWPGAPHLRQKYENDLKGFLYQLGWNATHPEPHKQLRGMIYDIAFKKSKTPEFDIVLQPPPGPAEVKAIRSLLELAQAMLAMDPPPANPLACFSFNKTCPWFVQKLCGRYT